MARKAQDLGCERDQAQDARIFRRESRRTDALGIDLLTVPPLNALGEPVDVGEFEAERLADIAQGAPRSVADHGRRQRRTLASVLAVNILDDLFATLMLEIHIDVRRLVALLGNEALEQHRHPRGIDFGDLQAITDDGIGRRAASLTQDAARTRELDDVVYGQKERLIAQFGDQTQFVFDAVTHGPRDAGRPAHAGTSLRELTQVRRRRRVRRHDLFGVFVAQFLETEAAARGDLQRRGQQRLRIQFAQTRDAAQRTLAVRKQRETGGRDRRAQTNRGQDILQRTAAASVHMHIARGDARNTQGFTQGFQHGEPPGIDTAREQFHADP